MLLRLHLQANRSMSLARGEPVLNLRCGCNSGILVVPTSAQALLGPQDRHARPQEFGQG